MYNNNEEIAIHESGHCIVAICLEIKFEKVTIKRMATKNSSDEICLTAPEVTVKNLENYTKKENRIVAIAGSVTQAILTKHRFANVPAKVPQPKFTITEKTKHFLNSNNNKKDFELYNENTNAENTLDEDINTTKKILENNWQSVEGVAKELEIKKTLTYNEVLEIFKLCKTL